MSCYWDLNKLFSCFKLKKNAIDRERSAILAYIVDRTDPCNWGVSGVEDHDYLLSRLREVLDGIDRGDHRDAYRHGEYEELLSRETVSAECTEVEKRWPI
jgi:hypothetical protein